MSEIETGEIEPSSQAPKPGARKAPKRADVAAAPVHGSSRIAELEAEVAELRRSLAALQRR